MWGNVVLSFTFIFINNSKLSIHSKYGVFSSLFSSHHSFKALVAVAILMINHPMSLFLSANYTSLALFVGLTSWIQHYPRDWFCCIYFANFLCPIENLTSLIPQFIRYEYIFITSQLTLPLIFHHFL